MLLKPGFMHWIYAVRTEQPYWPKSQLSYVSNPEFFKIKIALNLFFSPLAADLFVPAANKITCAYTTTKAERSLSARSGVYIQHKRHRNIACK